MEMEMEMEGVNGERDVEWKSYAQLGWHETGSGWRFLR